MPLVDIRGKLKVLLAEMEVIKTTLVEQPVSDYAAYREAIGRYQGLKLAIAQLKIEDEDDDN